jgi:hypothetical protein
LQWKRKLTADDQKVRAACRRLANGFHGPQDWAR